MDQLFHKILHGNYKEVIIHHYQNGFHKGVLFLWDIYNKVNNF